MIDFYKNTRDPQPEAFSDSLNEYGIEEKVFFYPGDVVTIRQDIPNKPTMLVVKKQTMTIRDGENKQQVLRGIVCKWFTTTGELQEALFSSKDLIKL